MNPIDLVTEQEINAFSSYISEYAEMPAEVPIRYILREWNEKKQPIFDTVFSGKTLTLSKEVTFTKTISQISAEINSKWDDMPTQASTFYNHFTRLCAENRHKIWGNRSRYATSYNEKEYNHRCILEGNWIKCEQMFDSEGLAKNEVLHEFTIDLPKSDGTTRPYKVSKGTKPMRALGRIVKAYMPECEEEFKQFCIWHSQILNDKSVKGELCLSIHPLDYITMSDNTYDWSSCMSWKENGCYRSGTVEMMNSPMVIVAYLKSANEVNPLKIETCWNTTVNWNSKKWRTLLIVNNTGVYSIKSYPYAHKEMTQECISWITELLDEEYKPIQKLYPYRTTSVLHNGEEVGVVVHPSTNRMYNDFGSTTHYVAFNQHYIDLVSQSEEYKEGFAREEHFCYSGAAECMCCGALSNSNNKLEFDGEQALCCDDCNPEMDAVYCEECGCHVHSDDVIYIGDTPVCPDCFQEVGFFDVITNESGWAEDALTICIKSKNGEIFHLGKSFDISILSIVERKYRDKVKELIENVCNDKPEVIIPQQYLNERGNRIVSSRKFLAVDPSLNF